MVAAMGSGSGTHSPSVYHAIVAAVNPWGSDAPQGLLGTWEAVAVCCLSFCLFQWLNQHVAYFRDAVSPDVKRDLRRVLLGGLALNLLSWNLSRVIIPIDMLFWHAHQLMCWVVPAPWQPSQLAVWGPWTATLLTLIGPSVQQWLYSPPQPDVGNNYAGNYAGRLHPDLGKAPRGMARTRKHRKTRRGRRKRAGKGTGGWQ